MQPSDAANREKHVVALTSVIAAVALTGMKLVVGLLTGSLGILSEAAHSGLDLVAAVVTLFAVRVSSRPADRDHTYGHGKVENLSALFETLLLLLTCFWIFWEAGQRLLFKHVPVEVTWWAFAVMGISIVVDFSRSRALARVAKKYNSQALEADALHFSTDIWSSAVVIVGLGLVLLSHRWNLPWLAKADAIAALVVAGIVVYVSLRLGQRTISALLDGIPASTRDEIYELIREVPGVQFIDRLRVRISGPEAFADVTLRIARDTPLEKAHEIVAQAEEAVRQVLPAADVVVQVNPTSSPNESLLTQVRLLAARHGMGAHGIRLYNTPGRQTLELHLEVSDKISLQEAHAQADAFEVELRKAVAGIDRIVTHLEPTGETSTAREAEPVDEDQLLDVLEDLPHELGVDFKPHSIQMHHTQGELAVSFDCVLPSKVPITEAHDLTVKIEESLRAQVPRLGRVVIHVEPPEAADDLKQ
jgi:cation diffusion facilitator family transporter